MGERIVGETQESADRWAGNKNHSEKLKAKMKEVLEAAIGFW